jgi:hypothetical protein
MTSAAVVIAATSIGAGWALRGATANQLATRAGHFCWPGSRSTTVASSAVGPEPPDNIWCRVG